MSAIPPAVSLASHGGIASPSRVHVRRAAAATTSARTKVRDRRASKAYRASSASLTPSVTQAGPVPVGVPGNWSLIFDDELNGNTLDLHIWNPNWFGKSTTQPSDPVNAQDESCNSPAEVSEGGGSLSLSTATGPCVADNGNRFPFAGSLIDTYGKFQFTYGFLEARIHIPTNASGAVVNTPSFWADGTGSWPATGELDVLEVCRGGFAYHFHSSKGAYGACVPIAQLGGWHTFGADWSLGSVTYYFDGRQVGSVTTGVTASPMYLILSQDVDPTLGGPALAPAHAMVDYVRVWQQRS